MVKRKLKFGIFKRQGINNKGRITIYNRGGGLKRRIYFIDYKRDIIGVPAKILKISSSSLNTSFIAYVYYICGYYSYILLAENLIVGDFVVTYDGLNYGSYIKMKGSVFELEDLLVGDEICNIERERGLGSVYCRGAGTFAKIVKKDYLGDRNFVVIKFSSGLYSFFKKNCRCVLGRVSNGEHRMRLIGKAGIQRLRGFRPVVRGVAMNPIDHPHGGGQGKTKGGRCSVTPWGRLTKGKKTRHVRKSKKYMIQID